MVVCLSMWSGEELATCPGLLLPCPETSWHKLLILREREAGIENGWLEEVCLIFLLVLLCMSALGGGAKLYNYIITWKQLIHRDRSPHRGHWFVKDADSLFLWQRDNTLELLPYLETGTSAATEKSLLMVW